MRPGAIVAGVMLLGLGVAMLLDTTGMLQVRAGRLIAPFVLIAVGSLIVLDHGGFAGARCPRDEDGGDDRPVRARRRRRGGAAGGIWLIGIGMWMLVSQTHMFGLTFHTSWPLVIVLMGLLMMIRGMR
jgi:hypothetical protein